MRAEQALSLCCCVLTASIVIGARPSVQEKRSAESTVDDETSNEVVELVTAEPSEEVELVTDLVAPTTRHTTRIPTPAVNGAVESCTALDCNNRGSCIGTKAMMVCICNLGFVGPTCDDIVCDSVRDCNGRGICMGTTKDLTCFCSPGHSGKNCEITMHKLH